MTKKIPQLVTKNSPTRDVIAPPKTLPNGSFYTTEEFHLMQEKEHKKRQAEEEELRRKRDAEEEEFRLTRVRKELHFQQQLEHAHLQAELNKAKAELSTKVSNIELANQIKTNNNILCKNGVNDKATNDHSAGDALLNANEAVKVKSKASHFKPELNVLSNNYAGAQVNENQGCGSGYFSNASASTPIASASAASAASASTAFASVAFASTNKK